MRIVCRLIVVIALCAVLAPWSAAARNAALEAKLKAAAAAGDLPGLHSVLILLDGAVYAEVYLEGSDERWGRFMGNVKHGPETLHDLRSVTKSIVSLLYGIALAEGKVPDPGESLVAQFPEFPDLAADPERRRIRIEDALTMQMGTAWNENLPYTDPRNSEIAMERAPDRYRYALGQKIETAPGERWVYNGGATTLIGRLIVKGTGMALDEYARERLFGPLGITRFEWSGLGDVSAASGLAMTARDLARIGQMLIDGGRYDGRQIVPAAWIKRSMAPRAWTGSLRYGYFWWMPPGEGAPPWVAGFGNGGQRLSMNPGLRLVFVAFAGNYNQPDAWKIPVKVITDFLAPALQAR